MYLDSSAIIALFVQDAHSGAMQRWVTEYNDALYISRLVVAEFSSAVSRRWRMKEISDSEAQNYILVFDQWHEMSTKLIPIVDDDLKQATAFVRQLELRLRTPDALHLALCIRHHLDITTFDRGLATAARTLGIKVEMPA